MTHSAGGRYHYCCSMLIDFSKAFDMVEHSILLKKLEHYGIRGKASQWINSYLHNIMQFVSIDGTDSETRHMQYDVPQGSILGPLLFIIHINDIPNASQIAKFILYADDANITITGNNIIEVDAQLRDLCKILLKWVESNDLCLNQGCKSRGRWGYSSPQRFRPIPPINICFHHPNKNMFPFPKNRLTYTHVTQH